MTTPRIWQWFAIAMVLAAARASHATTYYVDSAKGNDSATGTSIAAPWKSLTKVSGTTFSPGDTILLKAGSRWSGQELHPRGSGTAAQYIKIDRYDSGARPRIDGNGVQAVCQLGAAPVGAHPVYGVVNLVDQDYWEIRNIEVTNSFQLKDNICFMVGIKVRNTANHVFANHIYIGNTVVHDVTGHVGPTGDAPYEANAGIAITSDMNPANSCPIWPNACPANPAYDGITIENNTVYSVDRIAIYVGPDWALGAPYDNYSLFPRRMSNVAIRGNLLHDIGADGILTVMSAFVTIENNVLHDSGTRIISAGGVSAGIWTAMTEYSVIQHNEVYRYALPGPDGAQVVRDGEAFDTDWGTTYQTIQYNYSHDNGGGFLLICEVEPPGGPVVIDNLRVRYNLSYNDGLPSSAHAVFRFDCGNGTFPAGPDGADINNNLIYTSATATINAFYANTARIDGTAYLYNNIFYVPAGGALQFRDFAPCDQGGVCFGANVYSGSLAGASVPPDATAANRFDPMFVNPAPPGIGRSSADGLRLRAGSPALHSGYPPGWGIDGASNLGPIDFWGNAVGDPFPAPPNRGPYAGPGL
jgi:hypothetical protein